ncbi:family 20 glycosylhydrolase [Haliscomenobacter sp.]|uniref:glycoside hydrolase family 20 protein n=1 Tax=Haliscomenobacter sp. TaxID=2717303 RepID=UPI003364C4FD
MKYLIGLLLILFSWGYILAQSLPIIPLPQQITAKSGQFVVSSQTNIRFDLGNENVGLAASYFNQWLNSYAGYSLAFGKAEKNTIILELSPNVQLAEGYSLQITPDQIKIQAWQPAGLFYGIQSLIQLFPVRATGQSSLPCVDIQDQPAFGYRGVMLDVGRYFFGPEQVKSFIDMLARYKINRFHWHLTEDQGWRIEIKKYPKLQEISAWRNETLVGKLSNDAPKKFDGQKHGGFYTQEEVKDIVEYARQRFITIIPEIEMPGHAQAAIAAYPELGCTDQKLGVATYWGVSKNVFCPNEATFKFLEDVLSEVIPLFPSPYIHIGGDECPKDQWKTNAVAQEIIKREKLKDEHELQSYFIRRIEKYLNQHGKQIIGWDEILEGGLAPNATVMSWRGTEGGIEAAKQNHTVIMTPTSYCYIDYYQSLHPDEPLAIGGYLPLKKVYSYNPIPKELNAEQAKYILGAQANLWTEYIKEPSKLQYMANPRVQALAEVTWSGEAQKNFPDFVNRLLTHQQVWKREGYNFGNHLFDIDVQAAAEGNGVKINASNPSQQGTIRYSSNGSSPTVTSPAIGNKLDLNQTGTYVFQSFLDGQAIGRSAKLELNFHRAAGKKITLSTPPSPQYSGSGNGSLINGVVGSNLRFNDAEWLGFSGKDLVAVIDLGKATAVKAVKLRFFSSAGQWVYAPKAVKLSWSNDENRFEKSQSSTIAAGKDNIVAPTIALKKAKARYLKLEISNFGEIPAGAPGAGNRSWLFVDEIIVE